MESDLGEEKKRILEQFRSNIVDVVQPHHDDRFLLRWLRARNFVLEKAEKMFREDLKVRKKHGSDNILTTYELSEKIKPFETTAFLGFDREGHAVRFFNLGECDFIGLTRAETYLHNLHYFISVMEHDAKKMKEHNEKIGQHVEKSIYIADFSDFELRQFCDKEVIRTTSRLINYYQDHYPETLHALHMINAPTFFLYVFNIFKPLFNEIMLKKIKIFTDDSWQKEVFRIVPREIVPAYVGGTRFEPEGDPKCNAIMKWNKKIPPSLYLSECCSSLAGDPGVHQKVVRGRSTFEVERILDRPGLILSWAFQTKEYNIKFGLLYRTKVHSEEGKGLISSKRSKKEELMPIESVDCHQFAETGEYLCSRPGIYILHFDNTYSWMTSKHLYYKTEVKQDITCDKDET